MAQFPGRTNQDRFLQTPGRCVPRLGEARWLDAYKPERGRYHLYVSFACPWAHRTIILRKLKGLEDTIGMTVVDPVRDERGWAFRDGPGHSEDPVNGFKFLSEAYHATDPNYRGRVTVPVLWDKQTKRIVSNSDDDLLADVQQRVREFATNDYDFYPADLQDEIDALNKTIYERVNNGVYLAGFATAPKTLRTRREKIVRDARRTRRAPRRANAIYSASA